MSLRRPFRILHLGPVAATAVGGISAYLVGLLATPRPAHFEITAVDTSGMAWRRLRVLRPVATLLFSSRLVWRLATRRTDLVHVHSSSQLSFWEKAFLVALARRLGARTVLHLHDGGAVPWLESLGPRAAGFARRALTGADRVIVLNEPARRGVEQFAPRAQVVTLPNAIHVETFAPAAARPARKGPVEILFVGMLSEEKGLDDLRAALCELVPRSDWHANIAGEGPQKGDRQRRQAEFEAAGLRGRVQFHGMVTGDAKLALLTAADLFVLPSRSESFGIANLEAMAAGLPVVSTRVGAIPDYIDHGVHGLLVPPADVPALTAALQMLLEDPALRTRLGAQSRVRVADYDWSRVLTQLTAVYESILRSK